jgi:hypothetical protein
LKEVLLVKVVDKTQCLELSLDEEEVQVVKAEQAVMVVQDPA